LNRYGKYNSRKVDTPDGRFDSQKEYRRWCELKLMQRAGEISGLERQKKIVLIPSQRADGKCIERECSYIADFVYVTKDGKKTVEDAKGCRTKEYIIKRKLMLYLYGIRIKEV
jgi:hypothetical protein